MLLFAGAALSVTALVLTPSARTPVDCFSSLTISASTKPFLFPSFTVFEGVLLEAFLEFVALSMSFPSPVRDLLGTSMTSSVRSTTSLALFDLRLTTSMLPLPVLLTVDLEGLGVFFKEQVGVVVGT